MPWDKKKPPWMEPPEGAFTAPTLLDDRGNMAFSPNGIVEVRGTVHGVAGTFAVANAKHKPLPMGGRKGAVFVEDGTQGEVRAVGDETVMVLFPPPLGLLHIRRTELWNPEGYDTRRRWSWLRTGRLSVRVDHND